MDKTCPGCHRVLDVREFYGCKVTVDGLQTRCKDCMKDTVARWRIENSTRRKQYDLRWAKENPEKVALKRIKRRVGWVETDITSGWLERLWNKTRFCVECGKRMEDNGSYPNGKHLDHIIPVGIAGCFAHVKSNVRYICAECNLIKGVKLWLDDEYYRMSISYEIFE